MKRNCLKQKRWFITGVSSGFGKALAELALQRGHFVAGVVRNKEAAERFEATAPGRSLAYWADVGKTQCLGKSMCCSFKALGGIDVLVNNAGYGLCGAVQDTPEEELRALFEINFWGAVRATQAMLPKMREAGRGVILNVTCDYPGGPGWAAHSAASAALQAFSESLAQEVGPQGIHVCQLRLGPLRTGWADRAHRYGELYQPPQDQGADAAEAAAEVMAALETCSLPPILHIGAFSKKVSTAL